MYKIDFLPRKLKNITFISETSKGEFDVIVPMIIKMKKMKPELSIQLLILNKKLFKNIKNDKFLNLFLIKYDINLIPIKTFFQKLNIFKILICSDLILSTENLRLKFLLSIYILCITINKKFLLFRHSSAPEYSLKTFLTRYLFLKKRIGMISITKEDMIVKKRAGYRECYFTNLSYTFQDYIRFGKNFSLKEKFILIFSYKSNNKFFNFYEKVKIYKSIFEWRNKNFKHTKIVIKPHPSETDMEINKILRILNFNNYIILRNNSITLIKNCIFSFSLNNNGGLFTYFNNIPTLNYINYISYKKFLRYSQITIDKKVFSQSVKAGMISTFNEKGLKKINNTEGNIWTPKKIIRKINYF